MKNLVKGVNNIKFLCGKHLQTGRAGSVSDLFGVKLGGELKDAGNFLYNALHGDHSGRFTLITL